MTGQADIKFSKTWCLPPPSISTTTNQPLTISIKCPILQDHNPPPADLPKIEIFNKNNQKIYSQPCNYDNNYYHYNKLLYCDCDKTGLVQYHQISLEESDMGGTWEEGMKLSLTVNDVRRIQSDEDFVIFASKKEKSCDICEKMGATCCLDENCSETSNYEDVCRVPPSGTGWWPYIFGAVADNQGFYDPVTDESDDDDDWTPFLIFLLILLVIIGLLYLLHQLKVLQPIIDKLKNNKNIAQILDQLNSLMPENFLKNIKNEVKIYSEETAMLVKLKKLEKMNSLSSYRNYVEVCEAYLEEHYGGKNEDDDNDDKIKNSSALYKVVKDYHRPNIENYEKRRADSLNGYLKILNDQKLIEVFEDPSHPFLDQEKFNIINDITKFLVVCEEDDSELSKIINPELLNLQKSNQKCCENYKKSINDLYVLMDFDEEGTWKPGQGDKDRFRKIEKIHQLNLVKSVYPSMEGRGVACPDFVTQLRANVP